MKQFVLLSLTCLTLWGCKQAPHKEAPFKMIDQVDFSQVHIQDNFWSPRLKKHISTTLPVCIDQIENQTGRIRNFENAAKREGEHSGIFFDDSDVYKALEGMAYSLINNPNPELEKKADEWIDKFAAAQLPDGYINTYYTLTAPEKRWTNMDKHEMYCAGHMIEAGVAYYKATGKRKLLDVCIRMTDHMMSIFGPGKRDWVPGHEEIELALVKLYQTTGEQKYLDFADWLIEERGHGHGSKGGEGEWDPFYYQDDKPVREMSDIAGHAVRCMYLYCGMADVAALKQDSGYIESLNRLWDDVVLRNMYITGGIGSSRHNEGFTEDYDLPNLDAYCETCASVGMVLWNQRMNQFTGDSKYIDVLERSMYIGNSTEINTDNTNVTLRQETNYPWDGTVKLTVTPSNPLKKEIRLRIPSWCEQYTLSVNGQLVKAPTEKGYAVLNKEWKQGDVISLSMEMPVKLMTADPRVKQNIGKRAIQRGPLVYCMEEVDNPQDFDNLKIAANTSFNAQFNPKLLNGITTIKATTNELAITLIPYYTWDNRKAGKMKVWIDYNE